MSGAVLPPAIGAPAAAVGPSLLWPVPGVKVGSQYFFGADAGA
jgi:hypothetical protein